MNVSRRTVLMAMALVAQIACQSSTARVETSKLDLPKLDLPKLDHFDAADVDSSVNPCDDFYQYVCGKWAAANPIPADQPEWSTASPIQLWNETILEQTLAKDSEDDPKRTPTEQKVGDFFFTCMDEKSIDARSLEWLKPELDRIAALTDKRQIASQVAHLHQTIPGAWQFDDNQTNAALFGFTGSADFNDASHNVAQIDQGGLGMPGRSFYLDQDDKTKQIRAKYQLHVEKMLTLAGEPADQAKRDAAVVLDIETGLASAAMDAVSRRDPKNINHPMTLEEVKALTPSFDWAAYLTLVNAPASPHYIVTTPDFFKHVETALHDRSLDDWKTYLRWQMLHGSANGLSQAFVDENFDFFGRTLVGSEKLEPRWRRCVQSTDGALGEALGQVYVERAFPPASKKRMLELVGDIETQMGRDIQSQSWMESATKQRALEKLRAVLNKIGYPDQWRDYSSVSIGRANYLENRQHAANFEFERWVHKIGQPLDRTEWGMTPPTVNAYEDPQTNTINFPAGILQSPFFDLAAGDALNYGASGLVIGHELIHGFDDQGRKFDEHGNLRDWWTPADAEHYDQRGKCISDEYTQMIPEAGVKQNGRMTQGEDTADNGGMHLAFLALEDALARQGKKIDDKGPDGLTDRQRFFESYAFSWCAQLRPELMRTQVLTNPHSIPKYRVNNVVSNMPEFAQAFSCKVGQKMVRKNACRLW
jgi:putative endopeptidase